MKRMMIAVGLCLLALTTVGSSGCASTNKQLVAADATIHGGLARLDDNVHAFCKAPANTTVYAAPCADVNAPMIALLKAGDAFNRGVAAERATGFASLLGASTDVVKAFAKLPQGETAKWIQELADVIKLASDQSAK